MFNIIVIITGQVLLIFVLFFLVYNFIKSEIKYHTCIVKDCKEYKCGNANPYCKEHLFEFSRKWRETQKNSYKLSWDLYDKDSGRKLN